MIKLALRKGGNTQAYIFIVPESILLQDEISSYHKKWTIQRRLMSEWRYGLVLSGEYCKT
jgi:hypothetical protein